MMEWHFNFLETLGVIVIALAVLYVLGNIWFIGRWKEWW